MTFLDAEEKALLESVENDEWQSVPNLAQEIQRYNKYARSQVLEEIKVELPVDDMRYLQDLAQQTETSISLLIANMVHQYIASYTTKDCK
ncbi:hypothetical protein [Pseudanabaena sp. PCC 6802]|uniref:hypothetical protein n=1 Tax=Pseudanabaena sp. PCC 6802 TaxID=118173 RepID=UPI00034D6225|nr:hypothetical protein [Pseudanabaena sp. PCC 6802]